MVMRIETDLGSTGNSASRRLVIGSRPKTSASKTSATENATWRGLSGRLYRAGIEKFVHCRAPARAAYVLVRRDVSGRPFAVFAGLAISQTPTVNLARIRRRGARLGAVEVHLIDLTHADGTDTARRVARDIRAGIAHSS
jgi:hypothetical protein